MNLMEEWNKDFNKLLNYVAEHGKTAKEFSLEAMNLFIIVLAFQEKYAPKDENHDINS